MDEEELEDEVEEEEEGATEGGEEVDDSVRVVVAVELFSRGGTGPPPAALLPSPEPVAIRPSCIPMNEGTTDRRADGWMGQTNGTNERTRLPPPSKTPSSSSSSSSFLFLLFFFVFSTTVRTHARTQDAHTHVRTHVGRTHASTCSFLFFSLFLFLPFCFFIYFYLVRSFVRFLAPSFSFPLFDSSARARAPVLKRAPTRASISLFSLSRTQLYSFSPSLLLQRARASTTFLLSVSPPTRVFSFFLFLAE